MFMLREFVNDIDDIVAIVKGIATEGFVSS